MALDPLATTGDLEAWLGRALTAVEATRATPLLSSASTAVRTHTRQQVTRATSTRRVRAVGTRRSVGTRMWPALAKLPQRPVNAVSAVVDLDGNDIEFRWVGLTEVVVTLDGPLDITFDHGYDAENDDLGVLEAVTGIVCQIVARSLGVDPTETGTQQESADGYSYTLGSAASAGPVGMLDAEMTALDRLLGVKRAGSIQLGA